MLSGESRRSQRLPPGLCRRTEKEGADGMMASSVRPYIMDLGSVNGTFLNNERIDGERYYELLAQVTVAAAHPADSDIISY